MWKYDNCAFYAFNRLGGIRRPQHQHLTKYTTIAGLKSQSGQGY